MLTDTEKSKFTAHADSIGEWGSAADTAAAVAAWNTFIAPLLVAAAEREEAASHGHEDARAASDVAFARFCELGPSGAETIAAELATKLA